MLSLKQIKQNIFDLFHKKILTFSQYNKYLKENGIKVTTIHPGKFYSYFYIFKTDYDPNILKYFDYFPISFIFEINFGKSSTFTAINFHHLPVKIRKQFIHKLSNVRKNLTKITYNDLKLLNKFAPKAVRQYKTDSVDSLYEIPFDKIDDFIKLATNTYEGVSYTQKVNNFNKNKYN